MAHCCERQPLLPIKGGHEIKTVPSVPCNQKHQCAVLLRPFRDWLPPISVYFGCVHNELVALSNRHLVQRLVTKKRVAQRVANHWHMNLPQFKTRKYSEEEVIKNTSLVRRKRVKLAFEKIRERGLLDKDCNVQAFIKHEKSNVPDYADKAPRLIQYRSFKFTAAFQQYLQPIEHQIFKLGQNFGMRSKPNERLFAKGLNSWQRGEWVSHHWSKFSKPKAWLWDVSRLDAHMSKFLRELIEFPTYHRCNKNTRWFTSKMASNKCWTANGIHYTSRYTMCSGEACTSLGDSIVVAAALKYAYRNVKHSMLVDGDDSIIITESDAEIDNIFDDLGLPMKLEIANSIHEVDFCQCRPIRVGGRWRMVRDPIRILSRSPVTIKNFTGDQAYRDWLSSVGVGELACNDGVPVIQEWSIKLKSYGNMRKHFVDEVLIRRIGEKFTGPRPITSQAREDFALAFGIMPDTQRQWESEIRKRAVPFAITRSEPGL